MGDRLRSIENAIGMLVEEGIFVEKVSTIYETEPQNFHQQPQFLNCAIAVKTHVTAEQLLEICQKIEKIIGKNKKIPFGPRNIDIDILTFGGKNFSSPILTIPHPRMHERNFVLTPLKEIAPHIKIYGKSVDFFLEKCANQKVIPFKN
jgi:2-amino-4-hydroxy-6-hydroxymethyldihydropteridine diphosphokinase